MGRANAFAAAFKDYYYCLAPGCKRRSGKPEGIDRHMARDHGYCEHRAAPCIVRTCANVAGRDA